jgi:AP-3 complex subunit beta
MDPLTRGISLRTTCAIKHKEVAEDSLRALQKGSVDSSVYVRKSAAISVANLFLKQPGRILVESDEMFVIFERLLGDSEPTVLATTMMALYLVTKGNDSLTETTMSLVHQFYLRITNSLLELDWLGQVFAIELLKTYCLRNFKSGSQSEHYRLFVDNLNTVIRFSSSSCVVQTGLQALKDLDAHSENFDHVIANRMLQGSPEIQGMFLHNVGKKKAIKPFLINCFSDNSATKISKLEILSQSLTKRNAAFLLTETAQYIRSSQHTDSLFIEKCIAFIVKIGTDMAEDSGLHEWCLRTLIGLINSHDATVSNEAVTAVKSLIQATNCAKEEIMKKVFIYLSSIIETISSPLARASAIWLINLCHDTAPIVVPNVLRVVARELESQESTVKLELCMLAVKVQAFHEDNARTGDNGKSCPQAVSNQLLAPLIELMNYVLHVCSRDPSVGGLVRAVGSKKFDIPTIEAKLIQVEAEVVSESKSGTRVTEDTPDSIRAPKLFTKSSMHEGKSTSSDQSSSTCMLMHHNLCLYVV